MVKANLRALRRELKPFNNVVFGDNNFSNGGKNTIVGHCNYVNGSRNWVLTSNFNGKIDGDLVFGRWKI